jgi:ABC-2 type transport system ATP-binding protein
MEANGVAGSLVIRARNPRRFFEDFGRLVVSEELDIARLEPLDESAHAVLGYLLGGSGRT